MHSTHEASVMFGLSFNDFLINLGPVVLVILPVTLIPIYLIWGRKLSASAENRERVMRYKEKDAITDARLLKQSLFVLTLVIAGFMAAHSLGLQAATIAMFGAAVLLALTNLPRSTSEQSENVHKTFCEVE